MQPHARLNLTSRRRTAIGAAFVAALVVGCSSSSPSTSAQAGSTSGNAAGVSGSAGAGNEATAGSSSGAAASGGGSSGNAGTPGAGATSVGGQGDQGGQSATGGASSGGAGISGTGNAGGGGAGGGPAVNLPPLVTSAANAYWNTSAPLQVLTSGEAQLKVDESTKFQRWDGFGGCFNEMGWDALSVVSSEIPRAMKLLFDSVDGASFVYGRLPLGASDYSTSWYTLDDTAGDYTMTAFSITRDQQKLIPFVKAALDVNPQLYLWASPWVVPSWMMDGSSNMKSDAQTLGAHALYMARFVEEYAKLGLKISAIQPQNEPGYARVHWSQAELIDFMKTYLGPTLAQRNLTTEVWCGTMSKDPDDTNIAKATAADAGAMKYVKGFGVQWNLQAVVPTLAALAPVMQTEHRCGNYNFDSPYWDKSRYNTSKAQNDHLYGEESWQLIRDWIVAGVNSYSAWNMVLDTVGKSLDGWPQNALLVVDRDAKTLTPTAAYYAFRHYSQYVSPGATRIAISGSTDALAFKNPDGAVIAELYNGAAAAKQTSVGVSGKVYQFEVPAHGWATLRVAP